MDNAYGQAVASAWRAMWPAACRTKFQTSFRFGQSGAAFDCEEVNDHEFNRAFND
jgi:hypothetical protein